MATELLQLAVGQLDVKAHGVQAGVPIRDVTAAPITDTIGPLSTP